MRRAPEGHTTYRKGDIVVVMQVCREGCTLCPQYLGATALVLGPSSYPGYDLQFTRRRVGIDVSGFHARNLHRTGMTA